MTDQTDPQQDALDELQPPKRLQNVPGAPQRKPAKRAASADDAPTQAEGPQPANRGVRAIRAENDAPAAFQAPQEKSGGEGAGASSSPSAKAGSSTADAEQSDASSASVRGGKTSEDSDDGKGTGASGADGKGTGASGAGDEGPGASAADAENHARSGIKRAAVKSASLFNSYRLWRNIALAVAVIMVALLILFGLFSWNRWHRFDDASDVQGQWYAVGTEVPITIDSNSIRFDEKTVYEYTLDDDVKTMRFSLGNMEGCGHYWFSADREYLVIFDGDDYTKWETALDDLSRDAGNWFSSVFGDDLALPSGDGIIALSRTPNSGGITPTLDEGGANEEASSESQPPQSASDASEQSDGVSGDAASSTSAAGSQEGSPKDVFAEVADQAYDGAGRPSDGGDGQREGAYESVNPQEGSANDQADPGAAQHSGEGSG